MFVETKFFHKAGEGSGGGGGGGSDPHNLGYYADLTALQTAHPTGTNGDFAILGSTDTIWVWDSGTSAWKDTDTKGQVTSVNGQTGDVVLDLLPSQTGNAGKFLITNGTTAEWGAKLPASVLSTDSSGKGYQLARYGTTGLKVTCTWDNYGGKRGYYVFDANTFWGYYDAYSKPKLGDYNHPWDVVYANSLSNGQNNTITIPATAGVMAVQVSTMPTAASTNVGWIVQFTGTTDSTYTHGYIYECKAQGTSSETYAWEAVEVQAGGGGGLPSQTGNAGKFLTTDGTDASWSNNVIVSSVSEGGISISSTNTDISVRRVTIGNGTAAAGRYGVAIGYNARTGESSVAIGNTAKANGSCSFAAGEGATTTNYGIAIGCENKTTANYAIQIGGTYKTNSDANTFKVGNQNGNFELMSADGTIPKERLTKVVTTPSTAPVLAVADWSSNTQTITVTGVTATNTVFVAPAPASAADYASAGILCTAQAADSLTFTCTTVPSNAITLSVVILG